MSVDYIQKAVTYIREAQELALFGTMADARLSLFFRTSPLFYIMLPFIGLLLTVSAFINGYHLINAHNRNLDRWANFIISAICAALASVSLYGAGLSAILGFTFTVGPWFFFSSVLVASSHQLFMFALNAYRAYDSPQGSIQRMHYLQAALNNAFVGALLTAVIGAVVFAMLFPAIAPVAGTAFALTAVALTALDMMWRVIPRNGKKAIKGLFNLDKPELIDDETLEESSDSIYSRSLVNPQEHQYQKLFTRPDYSVEIRKMDLRSARIYLRQLISDKIISLNGDNSIPQDEKTVDKQALLKGLLRTMNAPVDISKERWLRTHPLAFQSFWAEKGDVEQIFDAVVVFQEQLKRSKQEESTMDSSYSLQPLDCSPY